MTSNKKGQVTVEYILLMVVFIFIANFIRDSVFNSSPNAGDTLFQSPWLKLSGMIESGNWNNPVLARQSHPGHSSRHLSYKGEPGP